jgi:hypothetical protein
MVVFGDNQYCVCNSSLISLSYPLFHLQHVDMTRSKLLVCSIKHVFQCGLSSCILGCQGGSYMILLLHSVVVLEDS